ncbi:MAG: hypothetical protein J5785_06790 [Spirochaetales bacterium]|nr:hypothetical protein [Spirochaetales bacterium]
MKKGTTVILFSLLTVLLLAGLCSCKPEPVVQENNLDPALIEAETIAAGTESPTLNAGVSGVTIPVWEISEDGYHNIPAAVLSGTDTGVTKALKAGIKNPVTFTNTEESNLIIMVCEGLTSELIESSAAQYGELILNSFPVKGNTLSKFTSAGGNLLGKCIAMEGYKTGTMGIVSNEYVSCSTLRKMFTQCPEETSVTEVCYNEFLFNSCGLKFVMGKGDFEDVFLPASAEYHNEVYKAHALKVHTFAEAAGLYRKNVYFEHAGAEVPVNKLYTIFDDSATLPSFRQETALALTWLADKRKINSLGMAAVLVYTPADGTLDGNEVQEFDEAVAVAVKFALENPDTIILVCGAPVDGTEQQVCFFGLGKGVSVRSTFYECVSSLF